MKHLSWNYRGYDDLGLGFTYGGLQSDWNATLLTKINEAWGNIDENVNVFISKNYLDIIGAIIIFDSKTKTILNKRFIPIELNTPKMYITSQEIENFSEIEHDNYASVTIINY